MGHRLSFDLEFFTAEDALVLPLSYQTEAIGRRADFAVSVVRRFASYVEFLVARDSERLKVDLAQDSPFRFRAPVQTVEGIWVADIEDLQVDKLLAYYGRAEPRDAADLFLILEEAPLDLLLTRGSERPGIRSVLVCRRLEPRGRFSGRTGALAGADGAALRPAATQGAVPGTRLAIACEGYVD